MTYDYFNTSNLAFGSKLTKAFVNLTKLSDDVNKKSKAVIDRWAAYQAMLYKNYLVPRPTEADNPVRTSEMYDLMSGNTLSIEALHFNNNKLYVKMHKFTPSTNRITELNGSTTLKEGYAFIQDAISNNNTSRTINFVSDISEGRGTLLFEYRVDNEGIINIVDDVSPLRLIPTDTSQYTNVSNVKTIKVNQGAYAHTTYRGTRKDSWGTNAKFNYTVPEDMCIIAQGSVDGFRVKRGSKTIMQTMGNQIGSFIIIYAKKGDVYTFEDCLRVFRVRYEQRKPEIREVE